MRRVHSVDTSQDTNALIDDDLSHGRRVQSATISCYASDCCGHRVQRRRLRQVVDVARSRSRTLSRRDHRSTGVWDGCPRGRWELWLPLGRELLVDTSETMWRPLDEGRGEIRTAAEGGTILIRKSRQGTSRRRLQNALPLLPLITPNTTISCENMATFATQCKER
jgi:hypothetical protein